MPQPMDGWLRYQQHRWRRPDAARWLRPDAARFLKPGTELSDVYPWLERKYPGQPRLPEGEGHGRYTFGRMNGGAADDEDRPRVYITKPDEPDQEDGGDGSGSGDSFGFGNFLQNLLLAVGIGPGIGHNQGPPLEDPPKSP